MLHEPKHDMQTTTINVVCTTRATNTRLNAISYLACTEIRLATPAWAEISKIIHTFETQRIARLFGLHRQLAISLLRKLGMYGECGRPGSYGILQCVQVKYATEFIYSLLDSSLIMGWKRETPIRSHDDHEKWPHPMIMNQNQPKYFVRTHT